MTPKGEETPLRAKVIRSSGLEPPRPVSRPAGAALASVVAACPASAKDGTRAAIERVREVACRYSDVESALGPPRAAVAPFDTAGTGVDTLGRLTHREASRP